MGTDVEWIQIVEKEGECVKGLSVKIVLEVRRRIRQTQVRILVTARIVTAPGLILFRVNNCWGGVIVPDKEFL